MLALPVSAVCNISCKVHQHIQTAASAPEGSCQHQQGFCVLSDLHKALDVFVSVRQITRGTRQIA